LVGSSPAERYLSRRVRQLLTASDGFGSAPKIFQMGVSEYSGRRQKYIPRCLKNIGRGVSEYFCPQKIGARREINIPGYVATVG
jgi:hypothetical protein